MPEQSPGECLAAVRQRVSAARRMLAVPRTCDLDQCSALFQEAQTDLEGLRTQLSQKPARNSELRLQALALSGEIRLTGALLEQAARYGRRWLALLATTASGYTAAGSPPPLPPQACISFFG